MATPTKRSQGETTAVADRQMPRFFIPTEAAALKGLTLNCFKYRRRAAPENAPEPVVAGDGHVFYRRADVLAWTPVTQQANKGRKRPCPKP